MKKRGLLSERRRLGFVFQSFELLPSLTALENVMLPSELKSEKSPETNAKNFLERVGLKNRQDHYLINYLVVSSKESQ